MYKSFINKHIWILLLSVSFIGYACGQQISPSVRISHGAVNGVFIERNGKTLAVYGDPNDEIKKAKMVLFTHFRRDVIWVQEGHSPMVSARPAQRHGIHCANQPDVHRKA
jgi:hypothetical protein